MLRVFAGSSKTMLPKQTDIEAFASLQAGDFSALGTIYDRYGEAVYRLALRMLGNVTEAEDLTQEVFLAFWRNSNYDPNRGSMLTFLMTITRSRAINRLSQKRSQLQLLERYGNILPPDSQNPLMDNVSLSEISQIVAEALQQIPENQRQILEMAYYDGLSQSEITEQLNIPLGTVKTRTRQGLLKLRKLLKNLVE